MTQTYVICEKCGQTNRVQVNTSKAPVCGACKNELNLKGATVETSDQTLPKLIQKSPLPVIVDVWAPWCGPCRAFAPTFEATASRNTDRFVFAKINSEDNQRFPNSLGIRGIPTLIVFKNGKEIARQAGAMSASQFESWLSQFS